MLRQVPQSGVTFECICPSKNSDIKVKEVFSMFNFTVGLLPPVEICMIFKFTSFKFCLGWVHTIQATEVKEVGFTAGGDSRGDKKTKDQKGAKIDSSDFSISSQP